MLHAFLERLKRVVHGADAQGDWRSLLLQTDWKVFAEHLLAQLEEKKDSAPWVVLVDEIPIFIKSMIECEGVASAHDFMYTLRNLRQKHPNIRWLYTGSIGLDTIARRNGIEGALVDLEVETVEPFSPAIAKQFLCHVAAKRGSKFEDEAISAVIRRLGWLSPYYLEKIAEASLDRVGTGSTITSDVGGRSSEFPPRVGTTNLLGHLAGTPGQELPRAGADPPLPDSSYRGPSP